MRRVPPLQTGAIDRQAQQAFSAIGLLMEFVASEVQQRAAAQAQIPVQITAVQVGFCGLGHREIVSIDISDYGDPLAVRMVRMPFTKYLKPRVDRHLPKCMPVWYAIPMSGMATGEALNIRDKDSAILDLASHASVRIPSKPEGTERLLSAYLQSSSRCFHERFYSDTHDAPERWPETYARTPLESFPACVRHVLLHPNGLLLKPAGIQLITRSLLAAGWHPRHIAGLVRSKFEDAAFQWGSAWESYEPATRADFYVRLFAGLYETGQDRLVDFNCASNGEKGFCFTFAHGLCQLEPARRALLERLPSLPALTFGLSDFPRAAFTIGEFSRFSRRIRECGFHELETNEP